MDDSEDLNISRIPNEFMEASNTVIKEKSRDTAVSFLMLPQPPKNDEQIRRFYDLLAIQSQGLHPIMYVHGLKTVVCASL